jgi:hypothetical protein
MSDEFRDYEEVDEGPESGINEEETDRRIQLLSETIREIEREIQDGATIKDRFDSFGYYFESLFDLPVDEIDNIEELIQAGDDEEKIEIYHVLKEELVNMYDKYFGIKFPDFDRVLLSELYTIYTVIYLGLVDLLCVYALGKAHQDKKTSGKKVLDDAIEQNKTKAVDIADSLVGNYIMNEDEFTQENIGRVVEYVDPGNNGYRLLFNSDQDPLAKVAIDNDAFRLRIKKEYLHPAFKYLFELVFRHYVELKDE